MERGRSVGSWPARGGVAGTVGAWPASWGRVRPGEGVAGPVGALPAP